MLETSEEDEIKLKEAKLELARALAETARAKVELLETRARSIRGSQSSTRSQRPIPEATIAEMEIENSFKARRP